jgi:hypothetical protein
VHYKRATHYIVMTPTVGSLLGRGVLKAKQPSSQQLVQRSNIDFDKMRDFARDAAVYWGLWRRGHIAFHWATPLYGLLSLRETQVWVSLPRVI